MKATRATQEKLQDILRIQGFTVRYEKGNFRGGHCIVLEERMVIINKFYPLESKVNTLAAVIRQIEVNDDLLTDEQIKLVARLREAPLPEKAKS